MLTSLKLPTVLLALVCSLAFSQTGNLGIFSNTADIGNPAIKGAAEFANGQYRITGAGANIWGKQDQFRYLWRQLPGNFTVTATLRFVGEGAEHRKAGIMIRQSLDPDATYADLMIHGNGMPALQWRSKPAEDTNTFDLPVQGPGTFKIKVVRTGVKVYIYVAKSDGELKKIANTEVSFHNPVLVGLAVCSHQADKAETVLFSEVSVEEQAPPPSAKTQ